MRTKIFYFSGSGNALAIARAIASRLGDADVLPMANHSEGYDGGDEERIGLVTPVYAWGPPRMVGEFAGRLRPRAEQYVFAVATCGGSVGRTLAMLRKALRGNGSDLHAGFAVRGGFMPRLPGMEEMAIIRLMRWLGRNQVPPRAADRIEGIVEAVDGKRQHRSETTNFVVDRLGSLIYAGAIRAFKNQDKGFAATDACTSCGVCVRVCPRQNVSLSNGRPTWHHNCEMCYACVLWCPEKAIAANGARPTGETHHPEITLDEMLLR